MHCSSQTWRALCYMEALGSAVHYFFCCVCFAVLRLFPLDGVSSSKLPQNVTVT